MQLKTLTALVLVAGCGVAASPPRPAPPDNVERGVQLYQNREFALAARTLEQATVEFPGNAKAWTYLGLARLELDRHEAAVSAFREALKQDDELAEAHYGLGLSHAHLGRVDDAISELERAVELRPTHAYAHYHLGLAFNKKGKTDRTLLHLQRFVELEPEAPEAAQVKALLAKLR